MPKKYPPDYVERARGVFSEVGTYGGVARIMGVSEPWVKKVIEASGQCSERAGSAGRPCKLAGREAEVLSLAAKGHSAAQITQILRLDVHPETVGYFLRKAQAARLKPGGQQGELNPAWRGGKHIDKDGYVLLRSVEHPNANSGGYVREHRLVMEQVLGRLLTADEIVHHRNGNKQDNHPSNLELFSSNTAHLRQTLKGKVPNWSRDGQQRISKASRAWHQAGGMTTERWQAVWTGRDQYNHGPRLKKSE